MSRSGATMLCFAFVSFGSVDSASSDSLLYLQKAQEAFTAAHGSQANRPRKFIVSAYGLQGPGEGGCAEDLKAQAEALSLLGFNTVGVKNWFPSSSTVCQQAAVSGADIDAILDPLGLRRQININRLEHVLPSCPSIDSNRPLFDFDVASGDIDMWAKCAVEHTQLSNGADLPSEIVMAAVNDETSWCDPRHTSCGTDCRAAFEAYLADPGRAPDLALGQPAPLEPAQVGGDRGSRRLFYWSISFFADSAARLYGRISTALATATQNPDLSVYVNMPTNPLVYGTYRPLGSPAPTDQCASTEPLNAQAFLDPHELGRSSSLTLWTEDWTSDLDAQKWSLYADAMRSGESTAAVPFGGYVIGLCLGDDPDPRCINDFLRQPRAGVSYKLLSLVGKGAKAVSVYNWGGGSGSEPWMDRFGLYEPVVEATQQIGWGERLLYPGQPARGSVAILTIGASRLWDPNPPLDGSSPHYVQELHGLHFALTHAGYVVDFVDATDILERDALARYRALYVTEPNVPWPVQQRIASWVRSEGGTLVAMPGALTADQFDTCTGDTSGCTPSSPEDHVSEIDSLLGLEGRCAVRTTIAETSTPICNAVLTGTIPGYCRKPPNVATPPPPHSCSPPGEPRLEVRALLSFGNHGIPAFPANAEYALRGPIVPLHAQPGSLGPTTIATVSRSAPLLPGGTLAAAADGTGCDVSVEGAGITLKDYCAAGTPCGHAIAYAFFPGFEYWITPDSMNCRPGVASCPDTVDYYSGPICHWDRGVRSLVTAPADMVGAEKPVVVQAVGSSGPAPEVEVDRLDSEHGIALVALNWTFEDTGPLRLTVPNAGDFSVVISHAKGLLSSTAAGKDLVIDLPDGVADVDVLMIPEPNGQWMLFAGIASLILLARIRPRFARADIRS
ncbi:MAG TPA: hypothetical protein VMS55_07610 [Myxococcota bacterium]|nr:hypothetical protein [Myxococcota bacterium]